MKRGMWIAGGVVALLAAGLLGGNVIRGRQTAEKADVPPPVPWESIPALANQVDLSKETHVDLWGELVTSSSYERFYVGFFREPLGEVIPPDPDLQRGIAAKSGLFRVKLPADAGKVYLYVIPAPADQAASEMPDSRRVVAWSGNPLEVRDRNIGAVRIEIP